MARTNTLRWGWLVVVLAGLVGGIAGEAWALITGGAGNTPLRDPGWPSGAAALFNHPGRVAWWEGPPFGGGEWHSECRGDAKALSALLAGLAAMEGPTRRVVVHDGVGASFWLNPNREPGKAADARIDWSLAVWVPAVWAQLKRLPPDLNPIDPADRDVGPPTQVDVYTGGGITWSEVVVPPGLTVRDERLAANGFDPADGVVFAGTIVDASTRGLLRGRVTLEPVGEPPRPSRQAGADADGRWALMKVLAGTYRVIADADGRVARVAYAVAPEGTPRLVRVDSALARAGALSGRVVDSDGRALAGVNVRVSNLDATGAPGRYPLATEPADETDANGRFRLEGLPVGAATLWARKPGFTGAGLGDPVRIPADDVTLTMRRASRVQVTVQFGPGGRAGGYVVSLIPEGGERVGLWTGSGEIDAEGRIVFEDVPPGRYTLTGRPNPGADDQQTLPKAVDLKGGESLDLSLRAK